MVTSIEKWTSAYQRPGQSYSNVLNILDKFYKNQGGQNFVSCNEILCEVYLQVQVGHQAWRQPVLTKSIAILATVISPFPAGHEHGRVGRGTGRYRVGTEQARGRSTLWGEDMHSPPHLFHKILWMNTFMLSSVQCKKIDTSRQMSCWILNRAWWCRNNARIGVRRSRTDDHNFQIDMILTVAQASRIASGTDCNTTQSIL